MKIKSARFLSSAVKPSQYPPPGPAEIAFAGRSNVGKSSLINSLLRRRNLVRVSATPGRTQVLNFFLINSDLIFVDLPGYGFARAPARLKAAWGPMVRTYLAARETLKGVIIILDVRREASARDVEFINWLASQGIYCRPVATKMDKVRQTKHLSALKDLRQSLPFDLPELIPFSAATAQGRAEVWTAIEDMVKA